MSDEEADELPLQYQRAFGSGLKRQRIDFVPQSTSSSTLRNTAISSSSFQEAYPSIPFPKSYGFSQSNELTPTSSNQEPLDTEQDPSSPKNTLETPSPLTTTQASSGHKTPLLCPICHLPTTTATSSTTSSSTPHEASLAHQVCLTHAHPPSALDRRRKGMQYLAAYGWDPDERRGLGAAGEGRLYPIPTKKKEGKAGIGAKEGVKEERKVVKRLGAGEVRKMEERNRRRGKVVEQMFWGDDGVNKMLGIGL